MVVNGTYDGVLSTKKDEKKEALEENWICSTPKRRGKEARKGRRITHKIEAGCR